MSGVNKVILVATLGRDPEVQYLQSGVAVATISAATSETWNDKQTGEKKEKTEWHRIKAFGVPAENAGKYLAKGSQVYVEGKLQTSQYTKDGVERYSTEIIANNIQYLSKKQEGQPQPQNNFQAPQQQGGGINSPQQGFNQAPQNQGSFQGPPDDQDIPF